MDGYRFIAVFIAFFLGLIPASIADGKGRNFFLWWFYGWMLFIVALIHSLVMKPKIRGCSNRMLKKIKKQQLQEKNKFR